MESQIPLATKVLVDMSFVLDILLHLLIREVSERRGIDRRWLNARTSFARLQNAAFAAPAWPCNEDVAA